MESTSSSESNLATAKAVLSAAASVTATVMVARSITQDLLPEDLRYYFSSALQGFLARFSSQLTLVIEEYDGLVSNQIYDAAQIYLSAKISPTTRRLRVAKPAGEDNLNISMEPCEEVVDVFGGAKLKWVVASRPVETGFGASRGRGRGRRRTMDLVATESEARFFMLSFHNKHKDMVLSTYLPHVVEEAKGKRQEKKTLKLFTPCYERMYHSSLSDVWTPINLDHPATFETLAMEAATKQFIMDDLNRFVKRREYYRKVGKAWKRGYLLYGPPGTGKSSLIAAMANYLKFDIYDLELTEVTQNSALRKLLVATANRSILVVEDIDCTIEFHDRMAEARAASSDCSEPENQVTLSGFLNFIDGLWSSCGDERIIIFTTNHKEKLDPALLRPGRMDVHVHMSYCTPCGFKLLASNYLGVKDHALFGEIDNLICTTEVTPAEVAEQMIKSEKPEDALKDMIQFLKMKIKENEELKSKKVEQELLAEKEGGKEAQEGYKI